MTCKIYEIQILVSRYEVSWQSATHPLGLRLALCNTSQSREIYKKIMWPQVLKHLLSDPLLEKKKKETIPYLLSFKDEKIKPKETKDIRIIQLVFGRK